MTQLVKTASDVSLGDWIDHSPHYGRVEVIRRTTGRPTIDFLLREPGVGATQMRTWPDVPPDTPLMVLLHMESVDPLEAHHPYRT